MYSKLSDVIERFANEVILTSASTMELKKNVEMKTTPEDIAEVIRILQSPSEKVLKTAGRAAGVAALLLYLTTMFGSALADQGVKKDIAGELKKMQTKGQVEFRQLDNFKKDLPPEPAAGTPDEFEEINKLLAESRGMTVQEKEQAKGFTAAPVPVGSAKLRPNNVKEMAAATAIKKVVDKLLKDKPAGFEQKVDALVKAFNTKRPIKYA